LCIITLVAADGSEIYAHTIRSCVCCDWLGRETVRRGICRTPLDARREAGRLVVLCGPVLVLATFIGCFLCAGVTVAGITSDCPSSLTMSAAHITRHNTVTTSLVNYNSCYSFILQVLWSLLIPAIWPRHQLFHGVVSVRLRLLLVGTCKLCSSWSVTGHSHRKVIGQDPIRAYLQDMGLGLSRNGWAETMSDEGDQNLAVR